MCDHGVTNEIFSSDSNYIVGLIIWPKFGNSNISMREVIITSILEGFDQKSHFFFEELSWFNFNNLGLAVDLKLKFYISVVYIKV